MMKKFYIMDLKKEYEIDIMSKNLKRRLEKQFEVNKDCHNRTYIIGEESKITDTMNLIKQEEILKKITNPIERFETLLNGISEFQKKKYKFTMKTYSEYAIANLNQSNAKNIMVAVQGHFYTLLLIIETISEDICNVSDEEICQLFNKEMSFTIKRCLSSYIKYLKKYYADDISFSLGNKIIRNKNQKTIDDFYTPEEWYFYVNYLCDIDKHIINAFENKVYAKYWLFLILHLSLTWRKSDIATFPALENLILDKYNLEWFYENEFTMEDALYIISNTKLYVEHYYTHKTGAKLHFNIGTSLMIPTAIALLIMEQWRRKENGDCLFITKFIETRNFHKYFNGMMDGFSSLKANRTLLSFANEKSDKLNISASIPIAAYMRSHKMDCYKNADSVKVYLKSSYDDRELDYISKELFEKGAFGWLFDYVISVYDDKKESKFQSYDIEALENISGYLLSENCKKQTVINELIQYSKEELDDILRGNRSSKAEYVYCIKQQCNRKLESNCLECRYSIPTIFAMYSVADDIQMLLEKLEKLNPEYKRDKERYLYRLLKLLGVAKSFKNVYGETNLKLFLNFDNVMQQTKNLLGGG